jgi:hypothetical protein
METSKEVSLVAQMRGDAAMHRHRGRDWSADLLVRGADEIERLRAAAMKVCRFQSTDEYAAAIEELEAALFPETSGEPR